MKHLVRLICLASFLLSPFILMAHGYWIELEGTHKVNEPVTVKLFYGDYPDGERMSGKSLDKMKDIKIYIQHSGTEKKQIEMKQTNDYWVGTFTPSSSASYEVTGINDEREVQDWTAHNLGITRPIQYLKAYYTIGKQADEPTIALPLDVSLKHIAQGTYQIIVKQDGRLLPSQNLFISAFGGEAKDLVTDGNGEATAVLHKPGLYILSIDWIDNTLGVFRDKSYETVRHRLDYSLYHH